MRERLPRTFELKETLTDPLSPDSYFRSFEESLEQNRLKLDAFLRLEQVLAELDTEGWRDLKERAVAELQRRDKVRGWQALFDVLSEAKAFAYLRRTGCASVKFIPRSTKGGVKTPDIEALRDGRRVLCEVKTINISQDEAETRKRTNEGEFVARDVDTALSDKLLAKLRSTLNHAIKQMDACDPQRQATRIVFTVFHCDDSVGDYQTEYFKQIDEAFSSDPVLGADLVFNPASNLFKPLPPMRSATIFEFQ